MRRGRDGGRGDGRTVRRYRMGALLASAVLAGLAGALDAHVVDFIGPNEYGFEPAVTILSFALLGGIGTPLAPVLGAWVLTLLPEVLRGIADCAAGRERPHHRARRAVPAARRPARAWRHAARRRGDEHGSAARQTARPDPLLELAGVGCRSPVDGVDASISGAGGRHPRRDRAQRRRQDHAVQPDLRPLRAERRTHRASAATDITPCPRIAARGSASPARSRTSASSAR